MKQLESQEPELVSLRSENKILKLHNDLKEKDLVEMRRSYGKLLTL
jgi:hypothetical protein